jgi:hypothetical protein
MCEGENSAEIREKIMARNEEVKKLDKESGISGVPVTDEVAAELEGVDSSKKEK